MAVCRPNRDTGGDFCVGEFVVVFEITSWKIDTQVKV